MNHSETALTVVLKVFPQLTNTGCKKYSLQQKRSHGAAVLSNPSIKYSDYFIFKKT